MCYSRVSSRVCIRRAPSHPAYRMWIALPASTCDHTPSPALDVFLQSEFGILGGPYFTPWSRARHPFLCSGAPPSYRSGIWAFLTAHSCLRGDPARPPLVLWHYVLTFTHRDWFEVEAEHETPLEPPNLPLDPFDDDPWPAQFLTPGQLDYPYQCCAERACVKYTSVAECQLQSYSTGTLEDLQLPPERARLRGTSILSHLPALLLTSLTPSFLIYIGPRRRPRQPDQEARQRNQRLRLTGSSAAPTEAAAHLHISCSNSTDSEQDERENQSVGEHAQSQVVTTPSVSRCCCLAHTVLVLFRPPKGGLWQRIKALLWCYPISMHSARNWLIWLTLCLLGCRPFARAGPGGRL